MHDETLFDLDPLGEESNALIMIQHDFDTDTMNKNEKKLWTGLTFGIFIYEDSVYT